MTAKRNGLKASSERSSIEPLLLRDEEAAVLLGVSRRTVATLASSGKLTPIHPAGMRMRRFARAEVVALVEQWVGEARGEGRRCDGSPETVQLRGLAL